MVLGLFDSPSPFKGQSYSSLRKQAQESGHPFIDPEFPPDDKSLFYTGGKASGLEWKRPKDICTNPKLFVEGASSNDVNQGEIGNCWFVAASSCLANKKEFLYKVIPDHKDQEWDDEHPEKYAGIFHFQFWRYGEWVDVTIDDFLPTRHGKLVSVHSKTDNEFWSALIEKAYAKLFGCYEVLDGGELAEALEDFTGGLSEPVDLIEGNYQGLPDERDKLFHVIKKEFEYNALMAAAIPAKSKDEMEQATEMGLVKGHAYGITAVKRVAIGEVTGLFSMFNQEKLEMIRLRNPWGGSEWKGAFSDGSKEWEKISKSEKEKIGLTVEEDGEFWMTFADYCQYFSHMCICRMVNTSFFSLRKKWYSSELHSEWSPPGRGGGCINNRDTFLNNPQFLFNVTEDEDEVMIALTQKSTRTSSDDDKMTIGFSVMKVEENRHYRVHKIQEIVKSSAFKNSRSVFLRHTFLKGRYIIVACTFQAGMSGNFMIRLFTSASNGNKELVRDKPKSSMSACCACIPLCKYPECITKIQVIKAVGLEKQDKIGGGDPYAIISCEGEKVRTPVKKDSLNPEWKTTAIFYRKYPMTKPITVEIWNSNTLMDSFMGRQEFGATEETDGLAVEANLLGRKNDDGKHPPGKLSVHIVTKRNLVAL